MSGQIDNDNDNEDKQVVYTVLSPMRVKYRAISTGQIEYTCNPLIISLIEGGKRPKTHMSHAVIFLIPLLHIAKIPNAHVALLI